MSHTRNGKIARLPRGIREQINRKLEDGMEAEPVLAWVNERPETQQVVREHFEGKPINPQNLSDWRLGGYQDWRREEERRELAGLLLEEGEEFAGTVTGANLGQRLGVVFALELAAQLRRWQREEGEPKERWRQLRELFRELAQLRREEHRAQSLKITQEKWARETEALEEAKQIILKETREREAKVLFKQAQSALFYFGHSPEANLGEAEVIRAINRGQALPAWVQRLLAEREGREEGPESRRLQAAAARRAGREQMQKPEVRASKSEGNPKSETRNSNPEKNENPPSLVSYGAAGEDPPSPKGYGAASEKEGKDATEPRRTGPDQGESSPIKVNQIENDEETSGSGRAA